MILVPVKNMDHSKHRLSPVLSPQQRRQLAEAMLEDVLDVLAICGRRSEVAVVTGDARAKLLATRRDFAIIEDGVNPGETGAIEMATEFCRRRGADYTLVMPCDIPLIQANEIDAIFAAAPPDGAVLVPSAAERGTNAAFRRPADLFPLRFGNDSFLPHLAAARATGKPVEVLRLPGIGMDIDDPEDLGALMAAPGKTRAQILLRQWSRVAQPASAHA
jgi:2-phospho-L-lactate guanylyltransferase